MAKKLTNETTTRVANPRSLWTGTQSNPSPEHDSLEEKLYAYAKKQGYPVKTMENPAPRKIEKLDPDVYVPHPMLPKIFLGDAKVAANEGPGREDTYNRIRKYVGTLARAARDGDIIGGWLAIITDEEDRADEWARTLDVIAAASGLTGPRRQMPNFLYEKFRGAWVIAWEFGPWAQGDRKIQLPTHTEFMKRRPGR